MSLGQTLRTAREAKGITTAEMASKTHLLIQVVEGLEAEDFRRIPAAIYGRGFIKLYCEVVGLDPKPLQAEFMALYANGGDKGTPAKAERRKATPPPPPPAQQAPVPPPPPEPKLEPPAPEPVPPPPVTPIEPEPTQEPIISTAPPPKAVTDLFSLNTQEKVTPSAPAPEPEPTAPAKKEESAPRRSYGELFEQAYAKEEPEGPSAAEKFHNTISNVSHGVFANVSKLPPNTGRMIAVGVAGIILLVLIFWGVMALYKATTPQPTEKPDVPTAAPASPAKAEPKPAPDKKPDVQSQKVNEADKKVAEKPATGKKSAPKQTQKKPEKKPAQPKSAELKASGVKVPPLYID